MYHADDVFSSLAEKKTFKKNCLPDAPECAERIPLEVKITDANGTILPGSGFHAAENGRLVINEILAPNMSPGSVAVTVKDLASGQEVRKTFEVK